MLRQGAGCSRGGAGGHGTTATGYRSRRAHTKTRTGCRTCRQRKVKCDETRPICTNCSKRGLHSECEYRDTVVWVHQTNPRPAVAPTSTSTSTSSPGTPSSSSSYQSAPRSDASACGSTPELSPGSIDLSSIDPNILPPRATAQTLTTTLACISDPTTALLTHTHCYTTSRHIPAPTSILPLDPASLTTLRLLHFFTTTTALSLSTRSAVQQLWQTHVPTLALRLADYPGQQYLLNVVLAVAALHAARIRFGGKEKQKEDLGKKRRREMEREQWLVVAREKHQLCLGGFRTAVARCASRGVGQRIFESKRGDPSNNEEGGYGCDDINSPGGYGENVAPKFNGEASREHEELEGVFLASGLLCFYGISVATLGMDQEIDCEVKRKAPSISLSPSRRASSPPATLPGPFLTWLPLARGTPAIIHLSPLGWGMISHAHLAPLASGMDTFVPHHPFTHIFSSLKSLLSPAYELHPRLPQPISPLTSDVFTKAMDTMKFSFERFFTYEDPVAAAMCFPVTVDDKFIISVLGRGGGGEGVEGDREGCGGIMEGDNVVLDRDPRSLVIMAHFMVLMVIIEYLLPGEKEVMGLVERDWRGSWDENGSDNDGDELDRNNDNRGLERDARQPDGESQSTKCEVRPCVNRGWWIADLGRHEIKAIARYLSDVDAEEMAMDIDGLVEGEERGGRWTRCMEWPLEMAHGDVAARVAHDYVPQGVIYQKKTGIL